MTNQTYQLEMMVPGVPLVLVQEMRQWLELGPGLSLGLFLLVVCPPSLAGSDRRAEKSRAGESWIELDLRRILWRNTNETRLTGTERSDEVFNSICKCHFIMFF